MSNMKLMKGLGAIVFAGMVGFGLAGNAYSDDEIIIKYRTHDGDRRSARVFRQNGDPHVDFERARGGTAIKQIYRRNEYSVEGAIEILREYGDYCELEDVVMIEDKSDDIDLVQDVLKVRHDYKRFNKADNEDKQKVVEDLFGKDEYSGHSINKESYIGSSDKEKYKEDRDIYTTEKDEKNKELDNIINLIELIDSLF